uniref:Uncharacterized protein n=1 Tax=Trichuris muris TaxID=70415 RepID=A0A5S6QES4_TRIMR
MFCYMALCPIRWLKRHLDKARPFIQEQPTIIVHSIIVDKVVFQTTCVADKRWSSPHWDFCAAETEFQAEQCGRQLRSNCLVHVPTETLQCSPVTQGHPRT